MAIHSGFLHPDFIRDRFTEEQIMQVYWYWQEYPFGHEVDHFMAAMNVSAMVGGDPASYMPRCRDNEFDIGMFGGLDQYAEKEGIEIGDH